MRERVGSEPDLESRIRVYSERGYFKRTGSETETRTGTEVKDEILRDKF